MKICFRDFLTFHENGQTECWSDSEFLLKIEINQCIVENKKKLPLLCLFYSFVILWSKTIKFMIQWIFSFILCHLTHTNTNLNILNDNFSLKDMKTWKHFNKSSWQAISPDIVSVNLNPLKKTKWNYWTL